jgi:hypothetical protein
LAEVIKDSLPGSEISTDYGKSGTWILNFLSFRNGVKVSGGYIVVQTEQMDAKGSSEYRKFLAGANEVWDWTRNYFFGYSPVYRLWMEQAKDIPVLFYGEMNGPREAVCKKVGALTVHGKFNSEIMAYVMRSKIVLSTHYYPRPDNDMPRIAPLLSVGAFVICERTADPRFNALSNHLCIVSREDIPKAVEYYLARPIERLAWIDKGYDFIRKHPHGSTWPA